MGESENMPHGAGTIRVNVEFPYSLKNYSPDA